MKLNLEKYTRKPFDVDAAQVTEENLEQLAEWIPGAEIREQKVNGEPKRYIKLKVKNSQNERQTKAFVGDWVLYSDSGSGWKVYTQNAFARTFEPLVVSSNGN